MGKVGLLMFSLLFTTILHAQSWQPKAWEKYLLDEQLKRETISRCQSIMGSSNSPKPYDSRLFRTVTSSDFIKDIPSYKKKSKTIVGDYDPSQSVFAEQDAATERARLAEGEYDGGFSLLTSLVSSIADIINYNRKNNK